jgi:hypothetical protein
MKKKNFNKKTIGRVIELPPETNLLFKKYLLYREEMSKDVNPKKIAVELFILGLHTVTKDLESLPLSGYINHQQ